MRIPANVIETGKYTSGGEFVYKLNQSPYKGYYYILNERFFEGKEYKADAQEIWGLRLEYNRLVVIVLAFVAMIATLKCIYLFL